MDLLDIYTNLIKSSQTKLNDANQLLKSHGGDGPHTLNPVKTKLYTMETVFIFSLIDAIQYLIDSQKKVVYLDAGSLYYDILCTELKQRHRTLIDTEVRDAHYFLDDYQVRQFIGILPHLPGVDWCDAEIPVGVDYLIQMPIISEKGLYGFGNIVV
jgi:hypothetical protein